MYLSNMCLMKISRAGDMVRQQHGVFFPTFPNSDLCCGEALGGLTKFMSQLLIAVEYLLRGY